MIPNQNKKNYDWIRVIEKVFEKSSILQRLLLSFWGTENVAFSAVALRPEPFAPYRILWKKSRGLPRSCLKFLFCLDREKLNLFHLNTPKLFLETWSKTFQNLQLNSKLSHKKRIFLRIFLIYNVDSWDIAKIWNGRSSIIRCLTIKPFIFYQTAWSRAILNGISVLFLP